MALESQVLSVSFNKGLDTKTDAKQLQAGALLVLENGIFTTPQEIRKRNGYVALPNLYKTGFSTTASLTSGNALATLNEQLVIMDGQSVYTFSEGEDFLVTTPQSVKRAISFEASFITPNVLSGFSGAGGRFTRSKLEPVSGIQLVATPTYLQSGQFRFTYYDTNINTDLRTFTRADVFSDVKILLNGTQFFVLAYQAGVLYWSNFPNPYYLSFVPAYMVLPLASGSSISQIFQIVQNTTNFYMFYKDNAGAYFIVKYDFLGAMITFDPVGAPPEQIEPGELLSTVNSSSIWLFYVRTGGGPLGTYARRYDYNLNLLIGDTLISADVDQTQLFTVDISASQVILYANASLQVRKYYLSVSGIIITTTASIAIRDVGLISEPYAGSDGVVYLIAGIPPNIQAAPNSTLIFEDLTPPTGVLTTATIVGKLANQSAPPSPYNSEILGADLISVTSSNHLLVPYYSATSTTALNGVINFIYSLKQANITFGAKIQNVTLANNIISTGALTTIFDGVGVAESGFIVYPVGSAADSGIAGSVGPGTYEYVGIYTWTDNYGNLTRSAPSLPAQITLAVAHRVNLTFTALTLTSDYKRPNVILEIYRTVASGTTFYKIASIANNLTGALLTYQDNSSDASIIGNTQLYTTGGEVDNISPPSFLSMVEFKNRIIGVNAENPYEWWYSKQVIQGFPVEFSDLFTQNIDQRGGPITIAAVLDDKLIFYKQYNIFYVIGDGPAPSGANNDFSYPQIITTDVGCRDRDSVVTVPSGLISQSQKGFYLLGRDLSTQYIGAPVEQYNSFITTSATVIPHTTQVRLTLSGGVILVYDYFMSQWSTFISATAGNLTFNDSLVYAEKYTALRPTGVVVEETAGVFTDTGDLIQLRLQTGWLYLSSLQGFQRVRKFLILGEAKSNTVLTCQIAYDFSSTVSQRDDISVVGAFTPMQYRIFTATQKCEAIQITLFDTPSATLNEGLSLSSLGFEIAVKKGLYKLPASQSYG